MTYPLNVPTNLFDIVQLNAYQIYQKLTVESRVPRKAWP